MFPLLCTVHRACAGGSAAACLLLPRRIPVASASMSGALFGLAMVATVFNRKKYWHWHRVAEMAAVLPFVTYQLAQPSMGHGVVLNGVRVGQYVPLVGGFLGAAAASGVLLLVRVIMRGLSRQAQAQADREGKGQEPVQGLIRLAASIMGIPLPPPRQQ
jgi:hypothetical protein